MRSVAEDLAMGSSIINHTGGVKISLRILKIFTCGSRAAWRSRPEFFFSRSRVQPDQVATKAMQDNRMISTRNGAIPRGAICAGVNVNGEWLSRLSQSHFSSQLLVCSIMKWDWAEWDSHSRISSHLIFRYYLALHLECAPQQLFHVGDSPLNLGHSKSYLHNQANNRMRAGGWSGLAACRRFLYICIL